MVVDKGFFAVLRKKRGHLKSHTEQLEEWWVYLYLPFLKNPGAD